mmetsp:Transcript_18722/g.52336  ORF Transcript_18722/g.52336 Transcript_18722/m.52336 type:complete len:204 (+) Transcript_18722:710-1321(+)
MPNGSMFRNSDSVFSDGPIKSTCNNFSFWHSSPAWARNFGLAIVYMTQALFSLATLRILDRACSDRTKVNVRVRTSQVPMEENSSSSSSSSLLSLVSYGAFSSAQVSNCAKDFNKIDRDITPVASDIRNIRLTSGRRPGGRHEASCSSSSSSSKKLGASKSCVGEILHLRLCTLLPVIGFSTGKLEQKDAFDEGDIHEKADRP